MSVNFAASVARFVRNQTNAVWSDPIGPDPNTGTWFGVEGLMSAGEPVESPTITKAVDCVLS